MSVTIHPTSWSDYNVDGSTLTEVARHIELLPEAGKTHWHATYSVARWDGANIGEASVDVTITVSMPHWPNSSSRPQAERDEWERFLGKLHEHEQGHIDLAVMYLQHADTLLNGQDEHTAAKQWQDNLDVLQQMSDQYDASNDHGRSAGTTITPPEDSTTDEAEAESVP
jgi:predicted secreted Zn-dependent protease